MSRLRFLRFSTVLAVHDELLEEHGGERGVRDISLLDYSLPHPGDAGNDGPAKRSEVAAAYAFGILRNRPFVDGNSRTALALLELFLSVNGRALNATDSECFNMIHESANGLHDLHDLNDWVIRHTS